jgi:hypothetical protein
MKNTIVCLLILTGLAARVDAGQDTVLLGSGGQLNGQTIDASHYVIEVAPGEQILGTVEVDIFNAQPGGSVFPVGATVTWGDPASAWWTVDSWAPTGWSNHSVIVDLTAPATKGVYYILVACAPRYTAAQVMSATSANCGATSILNDGNDLGRYWSFDDYRASRANGFLTVPTWSCDGEFVDQDRGANWVEVRVIDGTPEQIQLDAGGDVNGQPIDGTNTTVFVTVGEPLAISAKLRAYNAEPSASVVPVAGTATWDDRESQVWTIAGDLGGPGWYTLTAAVQKTAPTVPGTYYLIFGMAPHFTGAQVMSASSANCGSAALWYDGNDRGWDWEAREFDESRDDGYTTIWQWSCDDQHFAPKLRGSNWIEIRVEQDCNSNGSTDSCDLDCSANGGLCDPETCGTSADCNMNGVPDECEEAVRYMYNDNEYLLSAPGSWEDAQAEAESLGGNLVTIEDRAENDWLFNTFVNCRSDLYFAWIGLYQDTSAPDYSEPNGGWVWSSRSDASYRQWNGPEPNNLGGGEDVTLMYGTDGDWNDMGPNSQGYREIPGIIEITDCNTNGVPDGFDPDFDDDGLIDACDPDIDDDGVLNELDACDFTPTSLPDHLIEPDGSVLGDLDGDCDVDLVDYAIMQERFTGPN